MLFFAIILTLTLSANTTNPTISPTQAPSMRCPELQYCNDGTEIRCTLRTTTINVNQTHTKVVETDDCQCQACPKKQVKFEFKATITADQFNTLKPNMTAQMANLLDVRQDYVNLNLRKAKNLTAQIRRNLNEGVDIEVTVKAEDEAEATKISNKVKESSFKTDLASSLSKAVETTVVVASVSEPQTMNVDPAKTTEEPEEEKSYTVIIVVVVLCVVLLGVGVFAYFKLNSDKAGFFDNELEMQH